MNLARTVLQSVVLATKQIQNVTSRYSTARGVRQVRQHSLVRLELEFQAIIDASQAILEILNDPSLSRHYMLDDRLMDWLSSAEPETCLDTLGKMEKCLNVRGNRDVQMFSGFAVTRPDCEEDDVNAAVVLFRAHQAHFHFLLTTDIWNHGNENHNHAMPPRIEQDRSQGLARDFVAESQRQQIRNKKLSKLVKLLDPLDCSRKHRETSSLRQSETCEWLPAKDAYKSWKKGDDSVLWLQGKAGAGKSVLASFAINDLSGTLRDGEIMIYFYCDFRTKRSTSAVEVMRSILAQLTARLCAMVDAEDLLDELLKETDTHTDTFYNAKGLSHYISKVATLCPRRPILVVDALDECREVESLLDGLIASSRDMQLFVTSRPLQTIISILSPFSCISMDKTSVELSADIALHITRELDSRHRLRKFDATLKEEIQSKLCARADGMFRWVQCQIDTLDKCASVAEIRTVLESLPEGLEETYRRILFAIERRLSDACVVRRALMWLVAALRPMRTSELLEAIMIDPDYRALDSRFRLINIADLLDICRSLVVHHEDTDVITLSHMSVKEYLIGELVLAKLPRYHIVLEDTHERLARLCMAYVAFCLEEMKDSRERLSTHILEGDATLAAFHRSHPLLRYVLSDGFNHLAHLGEDHAGIFEDMETLQMMIRRLTWEWERLRRSVPSIRTGVPWPTSEHDFVFYILIAFAPDALLRTLLRQTPRKPRDHTNALVYAAHFGKIEHAKVLVLHGAEVNGCGLIVEALEDVCVDANDTRPKEPHEDGWEPNVVDSDGHRATPLEVAVDRWHVTMVDFLLTQRSIVPARLLTRVLGERPHHFPLSIIRRLLQTSEFTEWVLTPWDNRQLLETLVEDDEEVHEQVDGGGEMSSIIETLVQIGLAEALLLTAVKKRCIHVVQTLLSMNASSTSCTDTIVNALADNGDTPMHVAMRQSDENRCLAITKLLVEAGCNPCKVDADDKPPIHTAVMQGLTSVVEYLLSQNVRLPSRILFGALSVTLPKRVEMIRLLITNGANVHALNVNGDTLLHATVRSLDRSVCLEIAQILINAGCNPSSFNPHRETPLHITARQGYYEVTNYLFLFSTTWNALLALLKCEASDPAPKLRMLVCNIDGPQLEQVAEDRVIQAITQFLTNEDQCFKLTETFVSSAGNSFRRSSGSAMLFNIAVVRGFSRLLEYLVSEMVPLPSKILFVALQHNRSMLAPLIAKGADVHQRGENGDNLLHVALSQPDEPFEIVQLLLKANCPVSTVNAAGVLPIHIAVSRGFLSSVEALLSDNSLARAPLSADLISIAFQHPKPTSMVRLLIAHGANVLYLAPNGDSLVHMVLRKHAETECLEVISMLAQAGCSPYTLNSSGIAPLHTVINRGFNTVLDFLLSTDDPLPSDILFHTLQSIPIFHWPVTQKWSLIFSSLVRKGADIHARDADGNSLMHCATQLPWGSLRAMELLVLAGCNPWMQNSQGKLPIHLAVDRGLASEVKYLLSLDASILPHDILITALECRAAHSEQNLEIMSTLVNKGAKAQVLAGNGDTMLHFALTQGRPRNDCSYLLKIVKVLVQAGCDVSALDHQGRTALEIAYSAGYTEVADYLRGRQLDTSLRQAISHVEPLRHLFSVDWIRYFYSSP